MRGADPRIVKWELLSVSLVTDPPYPHCVIRWDGETPKQAWVRIFVGVLRRELEFRRALAEEISGSGREWVTTVCECLAVGLTLEDAKAIYNRKERR